MNVKDGRTLCVYYVLSSVLAGLAFAGCMTQTGGGGNGDNNNSNGGGADLIFPEDYATTFREVCCCRPTNEHSNVGVLPEVGFASSIRVWITPEAEQAYLNAEALAQGTVLVKEEFSGLDCDEGTLISMTAMRKEQPGFDPEGDGDYSWQRATPDGEVLLNDKITCIGCHATAQGLARDYMRTEDCPGDCG